MNKNKMKSADVQHLIGRAIDVFSSNPRQMTGDFFTRRELRILQHRGIVRSYTMRQPQTGQVKRMWVLV